MSATNSMKSYYIAATYTVPTSIANALAEARKQDELPFFQAEGTRVIANVVVESDSVAEAVVEAIDEAELTIEQIVGHYWEVPVQLEPVQVQITETAGYVDSFLDNKDEDPDLVLAGAGGDE